MTGIVIESTLGDPISAPISWELMPLACCFLFFLFFCLTPFLSLAHYGPPTRCPGDGCRFHMHPTDPGSPTSDSVPESRRNSSDADSALCNAFEAQLKLDYDPRYSQSQEKIAVPCRRSSGLCSRLSPMTLFSYLEIPSRSASINVGAIRHPSYDKFFAAGSIPSSLANNDTLHTSMSTRLSDQLLFTGIFQDQVCNKERS